MKKIEIIKEKFREDLFAQKLGVILDELNENTVKMHMKLKSDLNNFYGRPHGGAIYGLADAAFSVLGNNKNNVSVALDCHITYHSSPDPEQILYVDGEIINQTRKIGTYLFTLYTKKKDKKKKVATMMSTLYRTGKPINSNFETQ
ncbi:MAG: Acyl-coenzyme A thioesterase PaaI [Promethearchaeota archaeon]|nr:MAG: Acyl-coenzyme A thioesterase PaaI [Candidatus Lokiarchaeota archaeon]